MFKHITLRLPRYLSLESLRVISPPTSPSLLWLVLAHNPGVTHITTPWGWRPLHHQPPSSGVFRHITLKGKVVMFPSHSRRACPSLTTTTEAVAATGSISHKKRGLLLITYFTDCPFSCICNSLNCLWSAYMTIQLEFRFLLKITLRRSWLSSAISWLSRTISWFSRTISWLSHALPCLPLALAWLSSAFLDASCHDLCSRDQLYF